MQITLLKIFNLFARFSQSFSFSIYTYFFFFFWSFISYNFSFFNASRSLGNLDISRRSQKRHCNGNLCHKCFVRFSVETFVLCQTLIVSFEFISLCQWEISKSFAAAYSTPPFQLLEILFYSPLEKLVSQFYTLQRES